MINITQMMSKPTTPSGDWLPAFYEAQLRLAQNISGGGYNIFSARKLLFPKYLADFWRTHYTRRRHKQYSAYCKGTL